MPSRPPRRCLVLLCLGILVACGSDDGAPADATENIELHAIIRSRGPLLVESVEYTVNCVGDEDSGVPDDVRIDGELELADSKAVKIGMLDTLNQTWTGFLHHQCGHAGHAL